MDTASAGTRILGSLRSAGGKGELRLGGEYRARLHASGWEGTGRVDACEPRRRLLLTVRQREDQDEGIIEVTLTAVGDQAVVVVWVERGMPENLLAAYGAGIQVHVEDLAAHIAGRDRCDSKARWEELFPAHRDLADQVN